MTVADPDQGITLNVGTDPADLPAQQNAEFGGLLVRLNRLYANEAARTANRTSLIENGISSLAAEDRVEVWNGVADVSLKTRALFQHVRRSTDAANINNSTALVSDPTLVTTLPAVTGIFKWRDVIYYSSSQVGDYKAAYLFTAGTVIWGGNGIAVGAAGTTGDAQFAVQTVSDASSAYGGAAVGTRLMLVVEGEISLAGVGTNLTLRYAQQTLDATNTVPAYAGSYREVWRMS